MEASFHSLPEGTFLIVATFLVGYALITLEHPLKLSKSATAVVTGTIAWALISVLHVLPYEKIVEEINSHFADIARIVLFLLSAMAIVETISAHNAFAVIINRIRIKKPLLLIWILAWISFFLSAVIDNMTTTIVMMAIIKSIFPVGEVRQIVAGLIVIAANAGGAWSPIGDVTTTMLWVGGQITAFNIIKELFLPSVICNLIPLVWVSLKYRKKIIEECGDSLSLPAQEIKPHGKIVFFLGIGGLLFIPVFKEVTHLSPTFGAIFALAILWVATEVLYRKETATQKLKLIYTIRSIDVGALVFFVGILLAVGALESTGFLHALAYWLDRVIPIKEIVLTILGLLSAIVDNIPLTAAVMGMYPLNVYPPDHKIWEFLAFAVGTGGSILVIGSAAGVVAMSLEKLEFFWYARKIGPLAFAGYIAGILAYLGMYALFHMK